MAQEQISAFTKAVAAQPQMLGDMVKASTKGDKFDPELFVQTAVKTGAQQGFSFTAEEANAWVKARQQTRQKGELSDKDLAGVAGGYDKNFNHTNGSLQEIDDNDGFAARGALQLPFHAVADVSENAYHGAVDFFSSW